VKLQKIKNGILLIKFVSGQIFLLFQKNGKKFIKDIKIKLLAFMRAFLDKKNIRN
jgi:hypothetical protein